MQIVIIHTSSLFIAIYPLDKWKWSKETNTFPLEKLSQIEIYFACVQVGIWFSENETNIYK